MSVGEQERAPLARVIVASNRAAAGVYADTSGPVLVEGLRGLGFAVGEPVVVPDGDPVGAAIREAAAQGVRVVLTSGGTGISPTDRTPEVTRALLDYEVPGIAEAVRAYGAPTVPTAILSRGIAGVLGRTLVVNLPGSRGGAKDGMAVLTPILRHAVSQLDGADHPPPPQPTPAPHAQTDSGDHAHSKPTGTQADLGPGHRGHGNPDASQPDTGDHAHSKPGASPADLGPGRGRGEPGGSQADPGHRTQASQAGPGEPGV